MENVLVTGATGYVGSHLAKRLVNDGYTVRALVRDAKKATELARFGIDLFEGDVRDPLAVAEAVRGMDTVYHIAAIFRQENVSRQDMWDTHVQGTRYLMDESIASNVKRFVHCSTIGVHGDIKSPPANEDAPYAPGDIYQQTKMEGEQLVIEYMSQRQLPISIFRPAGVYGPGDMRWLKLVRAIDKKLYVMIGPGTVKFHAVYIDDLVDGIIRCGTKEEALGNVYILAGQDPVALRDMFDMIADALKVKPLRLRLPFAPVYSASYLCELACKPLGINPPLYRRRVKFYRNTRWFDISKAKRDLGYHPETDMSTGLAETVNWFRKAGMI